MEKLDWSRLTDDLLENMVVTQTDLAEKCKVTQQSISNWKNGVRSPGRYARDKLFQLMTDAKLSKDFYILENGAQSKKRPRKMHASFPEDVTSFALKLSSYSKKRRLEAIAVADFLLERK
jgi:transcriptional regulator with XRE-family HTH domain